MQKKQLLFPFKGHYVQYHLISGSQNVIWRPAASASPGTMLEMQILGPHLRSIESEILRAETILCLNKKGSLMILTQSKV